MIAACRLNPRGVQLALGRFMNEFKNVFFASFANPSRPLRPVFRIGIKTIAAPASLVPANALFNPESAAAPALPWGWGLLLAGLGALGVWLGLRLRGGQSDEDPGQGDG